MKSSFYDLTQADLEFLVGAAAREVSDKTRLKTLIRNDEDFRNAFVGDEKTFQKVVEDPEIPLKISPRLYFEILLRKTKKELENISYTIERTGTQKIAVFDAGDAADLLARQEVLMYLADMLASFVKVESYTVAYRVKQGIWRKIRFSDLDIDSLMRFAETVDEEHRLGFFKRIADICLFILGLFPEYVEHTYRYPLSGELRPELPGWVKRSTEEYEREGRRYYELAAEQSVARINKLAEVFALLHEHFQAARKPLNFMADHYLHYRRAQFSRYASPE